MSPKHRAGRMVMFQISHKFLLPLLLFLKTSAKRNAAGSMLGRTVSEMQALESHKLLSAIEHDSVVQVRWELEAEDKGQEVDAVLTEPSLVEEHKFRTPLMAAVARGDLPIFTALLRRFEWRFSNNVRGNKTGF